MPTSRRSVTYIVIALAVIVLAAVLYKTFPSSNATTATAGQLDKAIHNIGVAGAQPNETISTTQAAEIQSDGQTVIWYSQSGTQYTTVESSADAVAKEFQGAFYYNYKDLQVGKVQHNYLETSTVHRSVFSHLVGRRFRFGQVPCCAHDMRAMRGKGASSLNTKPGRDSGHQNPLPLQFDAQQHLVRC